MRCKRDKGCLGSKKIVLTLINSFNYICPQFFLLYCSNEIRNYFNEPWLSRFHRNKRCGKISQ